MHGFVKFLIVLLRSVLLCFCTVLESEDNAMHKFVRVLDNPHFFFFYYNYLFSFSLRVTCRLLRDIKCYSHKEIIIITIIIIIIVIIIIVIITTILLLLLTGE